VPKHVGGFYVLCIFYQEVHLLENILKILQCSLAGYCPPSAEFRIGIFCFGFLAKDLVASISTVKILQQAVDSEFARVYDYGFP
jgi:hypothetical protein